VGDLEQLQDRGPVLSALNHRRRDLPLRIPATWIFAVSFSAEVMAPGSAVMELRAVLDGRVEASPGPVLFAEAVEGVSSRAFNSVFRKSPPARIASSLSFAMPGIQGPS
jgi:hypothetical protein